MSTNAILGERGDEGDPERDGRVGARGEREPPEEQHPDDGLRRRDRPRGRPGDPRGQAVRRQPVGQVLPTAQLGGGGPEQEQADDDPGDGRQLNHSRS